MAQQSEKTNSTSASGDEDSLRQPDAQTGETSEPSRRAQALPQPNTQAREASRLQPGARAGEGPRRESGAQDGEGSRRQSGAQAGEGFRRQPRTQEDENSRRQSGAQASEIPRRQLSVQAGENPRRQPGAQANRDSRRAPDTRFVNGVVVAALLVFFAIHGTLGSLKNFGLVAGTLSWLAWVGVGAIAVHVGLSVVTSRQQLGDVQRPPSPRKKRHLALKWATGAAVALAVCLHVFSMQTGGGVGGPSFPDLAITLVAIAALAVHIWVGSKSILVDLRLNKRHQSIVRIATCAVAATLALATLAALF